MQYREGGCIPVDLVEIAQNHPHQSDLAVFFDFFSFSAFTLITTQVTQTPPPASIASKLKRFCEDKPT
jgi:hypothetical protein